MEQVKYPIKYTLIRVDENGNGVSYVEPSLRASTTVAFIVSKCYLVGEKTEYFKEGKSKKSYDVVFPMGLPHLLGSKNWHMVIPDRNFAGEYINAWPSTYVFDCLEDALQLAEKCNASLLHEKIGSLQSDAPTTGEKVADIKTMHEKNLKLWKQIEQQLLEKTSDMVVFSTSLESLIAKVIERPEDFYRKLAETLSPEEREYMKLLLQDKSCMNCMNQCCRVESSEKVGLDETGKPQGSECIRWNNPELIGRLILKMRS